MARTVYIYRYAVASLAQIGLVKSSEQKGQIFVEPVSGIMSLNGYTDIINTFNTLYGGEGRTNIDVSQVPSLPASKITSGTLSSARLPIVPVSKGGTNNSSFSAYKLVVTGSVDETDNTANSLNDGPAFGSVDTILAGNGANQIPSFKSKSALDLQLVSNKVTSTLSASNTDVQYPSAKLVFTELTTLSNTLQQSINNVSSTLTSKIDTEISDRKSAINTEASTRENADTTLTNTLNNVLNNSSRIANAFGGGFSGGKNSLVAGVNLASGAAIGRDSWVYGGGVAGGRFARASNDSTLNQSGGAALGESSTVVGAGGAVGNNARNGAGFSGGFDARVKDDGEIGTHYIDAIQLGTGLNETPKSLQIYDDNIYNASTHTLTVEKAEVNGNPVATVSTATQNNATSGVQVGWYQVANLKTQGNYDIKIKQAYNYNLPEAIHLSISINNRFSTVEPFASITQLSGVRPASFALSKIRVRQGTDEGTTFLDVYNPDQLWNTTWVDITSDTQDVVVEPNSPFQFIGTEDNPSGYKISSLDLVTGFNTSNEIYRNGRPLAQLPKEYAVQVNTGSAAEYIHIGSFPIYDTNITVDISCTSTVTFSGRVVFPCTNHVVNTPYVYGDPYREISSRLFYSLQNNTIDLYFQAPTYQKMMYKVWYDTAGDSEPTVDGARLSTLPATATNTIPNALDRTSQLRVGGTVATLGVVSNLNTISQPVNSVVTYTFGGGCANAPTTDSGMVIQMQESTAFCTQLAIMNDSNASMWRRCYRNGNWYDWHRADVSPWNFSQNQLDIVTLFSGDVGSGNITLTQDLMSNFDAIFIVGASDNNVIKYVHSIPGWLLLDIYARSQNTNNLIDLISSSGYYRIKISSLNSTTLVVDGDNARINQIYAVRSVKD